MVYLIPRIELLGHVAAGRVNTTPQIARVDHEAATRAGMYLVVIEGVIEGVVGCAHALASTTRCMNAMRSRGM